MRTRGATALAACVLLLAACQSEPEAAPPVFDDSSPSATPTEPTTSAAAPVGGIPEEPVDGQLLRGTSAASTATQQEVAEVWFAYWTELLRMYRTTEADTDTLYSLAKDDAASGPLDYLARMVERGEHQEGGAIAAITSVKIAGDRATVRGCLRNTTLDVNADGVPGETPVLYLQTRDTLVREGPDWRVSANETTSNGVCDYR